MYLLVYNYVEGMIRIFPAEHLKKTLEERQKHIIQNLTDAIYRASEKTIKELTSIGQLANRVREQLAAANQTNKARPLESRLEEIEKHREVLSTLNLYLNIANGTLRGEKTEEEKINFFIDMCNEVIEETVKNPLNQSSKLASIQLFIDDLFLFSHPPGKNISSKKDKNLLEKIKNLKQQKSIDFLKGILELFFCQESLDTHLFNMIKEKLESILRWVNPQLQSINQETLEPLFKPVLKAYVGYPHNEIVVQLGSDGYPLNQAQRKQFNREFFAGLSTLLGFPSSRDLGTSITTPTRDEKPLDTVCEVLAKFSEMKIPEPLGQLLIEMLFQGYYQVYSTAYNAVLNALNQHLLLSSPKYAEMSSGSGNFTVAKSSTNTDIRFFLTRELGDTDSSSDTPGNNPHAPLEITPFLIVVEEVFIRYSTFKEDKVTVSCSAEVYQLSTHKSLSPELYDKISSHFKTNETVTNSVSFRILEASRAENVPSLDRSSDSDIIRRSTTPSVNEPAKTPPTKRGVEQESRQGSKRIHSSYEPPSSAVQMGGAMNPSPFSQARRDLEWFAFHTSSSEGQTGSRNSAAAGTSGMNQYEAGRQLALLYTSVSSHSSSSHETPDDRIVRSPSP